jgi:hypothetical protein
MKTRSGGFPVSAGVLVATPIVVATERAPPEAPDAHLPVSDA